MKIALLGYGKMGKAIEGIAVAKNHAVDLKVNSKNAAAFSIDELKKCEVAIEFSTPQTVLQHIYRCFEANVPVIVGTTGWYEQLEKVKQDCLQKNQSLLWASNFSIGVNIFFEVNKKLAQLLNSQNQYDVAIEEIHHKEKLDSPSGTAITLANQIIENIGRKTKWVNELKSEIRNPESETNSRFEIQKQETGIRHPTSNSNLLILSRREDNVTGTHTIKYDSAVDSIEIRHTAHSRKGFADGALLAAEWLREKKGFFTMKDFLKL